MMLFRLVSKLRFLWSSTNQHGVHSPFVFNYLTKCIYKKPAFTHKKTVNVLLKSISYFTATNCYLATNDKLYNDIRDYYPDLNFNAPPYDLVYMNILEWPEFYRQGMHLIHKDTAIILTANHQNRQTVKLWKMLIEMPHFNVSIDMFHCGLLFKRKEQRKEHFKVRI